MIVEYTQEEKALSKSIFGPIQEEMRLLNMQIENHPYYLQKPDTKAFYEGVPDDLDSEEYMLATEASKAAMQEWLEGVPEDFKELNYEMAALRQKKARESGRLHHEAELRAFGELDKSPDSLIQNAIDQIQAVIDLEYQKMETAIDLEVLPFIPESHMVILDSETWKLNPEYVRERVLQELSLHLEYLANNQAAINQIQAAIDAALVNSLSIATEFEVKAELDYIERNGHNQKLKPQKKKSLMAYKADTHYMLNDKISGKLFGPDSNLFFQSTRIVGVEKSGSTPIDVAVSVSIPVQENGKITQKAIKMEYLDLCVLNTINSLLKSGNSVVSTGMIAKHLSGNQAYRTKGSDKFSESIEESMKRLMSYDIYIDAENEYKAKGSRYKGPKKIIRRLLPGTLTKEMVNGQDAWCYRPDNIAPLVEYAESKKQVAAIPTELLNDSLPLDEETAIIREYLLIRVSRMKGKTKQSNRILYDSLIAECGITAKTPTAMRTKVKPRIRKKVSTILDQWIFDEHIKSYESVIGARKAIVGIDITV